MNQRITEILDQLENVGPGADIRKLVLDLRGVLARDYSNYEAAIQKRGAHVRYVSPEGLLSEPAGRDILARAWQADPLRTEHDLLSLGARDAASFLGADYLAARHRSDQQLEMYRDPS